MITDCPHCCGSGCDRCEGGYLPSSIQTRPRRLPKTINHNKDRKFCTFLSYSDPTAREERTVFGAAKPGLFYNYDDRLFSEEWFRGLEIASEQADRDTARYFEIALNHFHGTDTVDLQHVVLGCNMSNGNSYLIFGYTYSTE